MIRGRINSGITKWICLSPAIILTIFSLNLRAEPSVLLTNNSISGSFFTGKIELNLAFSEVASPKISYLENPYRIILEFGEMNFERLPLDFGKSVRHLETLDFGKFSEGSKMIFTFDRPYAVTALVSSSKALAGKTGMHVAFAPSDAEAFAQNVESLGYEGSDLTFQTVIVDQDLSQKPLIVIDPGHGGNDPGALRDGVREKDVTLQAALLFAEGLRQTNRYQVELTRDHDTYVSLLERRRFGEKLGANLFLSIHADTVELSEVHGMTIYTLSAVASGQNAEKFALFENRVDMFGGDFFEADNNDLSSILAQMAQNKSMETAQKFSKAFQQSLMMDKFLAEIPKQESAAFAVLKAPDVPSLLIELGFLSNQSDRTRIQDPKWLDEVGKKLLQALDQIFYKTPK